MFDKILTAIIVFGFSFLAFALGTMMVVNKSDYRTISLANVTGVATATPDSAKIRIHINIENSESKEQTENIFNETVLKMREILQKNSIDEKNVNFENISSNEWTREETAEDGSKYEKTIYSRSQFLTLSLENENFEKFSEITQPLAIVKNLSIGNVEKGVKNPEKLYDLARENALKKAREQAETMAKNLGVRLGKVISIDTRNPYNDATPVAMMAEKTLENNNIIGLE